jgi:hypothetical protein
MLFFVSFQNKNLKMSLQSRYCAQLVRAQISNKAVRHHSIGHRIVNYVNHSSSFQLFLKASSSLQGLKMFPQAALCEHNLKK